MYMYLLPISQAYSCCCTYLHRGVEQLIGRFPDQVNVIKMDDGHSALHIAAANNHLDIVSLLSSMVGLNMALYTMYVYT